MLEEEGKDKAAIRSVQEQIFEKNQAYESLLKDLEKNNPRYFQLKYANAEIDFEVLENNLAKNDQTLLHYFYDQSQLYLFLWDKNGLQVKTQALPEQFSQAVRSVRVENVTKLLNGDRKALQQYRSNLSTIV